MTAISKAALLGHVESTAAVAAAARAFFLAPSAQAAGRADLCRRQAALDSRALRPAVPPELQSACRALDRLADHAGRCAEEARRFGVEPDRRTRAMAARLERSVAALKAAVRGWPGASCEEALASAKGAARDVERLQREARARAWADVRFVRGLAGESVLRRFSHAADAAQEAAEELAQALGAARP